MNQGQTWWESLRHFGMLLSPAEVMRIEADYEPVPLSGYRCEQLRREMNRLEAKQISTGDFASWVFEKVCRFQTLENGSVGVMCLLNSAMNL